MSGFQPRHHPRGQIGNPGQFRSKENRAPDSTITGTNERIPIDAFIRQRKDAASLFLSARNTFLLANRDAATVVLREQFPWATRAVFTRAWEDSEDQIILAQLIGPEQGLDIEGADAMFSAEQMQAMHRARLWVREMGEYVADYVEPADTEHDGWYEYTLDLTSPPGLKDSTAHTVDQLDEAERDNLYFHLSERDGRMASLVSRSEIEYQLTEGDIAQTDPELVQALHHAYGDLADAAAAIADSSAWFTFREGVADSLHERIDQAISDAGHALVAGKE